MALSGFSSSNHLVRTAPAWPGDRPFLLSAWARNVPIDLRAVISLDRNDGTNHQRTLARQTSIRFYERQTTGVASAGAPGDADWNSETWTHGAGHSISATSRAAYSGGTFKGTNSSSMSPFAPTHTYVGIVGGTEWPLGSGEVAEISVWDTDGLSESDVDDLVERLGTLVGGEIPNALEVNEDAEAWAGKLTAYWPLVSTADLEDKSGNGFHLSEVGEVTNVDHPAVEDSGDPDPPDTPRTVLGGGVSRKGMIG